MGSHHAAHTGDLAFSGPPSQDSLIQAMRETSFYGRRRPAAVEHLETHISHVFLTDDLVYKVKKAVRFAFLDYSTLARRRYFLHEEFRLNRRLAPSVYLGVLPISYGSDGWELGSNENPVEYTLIMRRLPARRMLDRLLESNQVTPQMMRSVAEILAPFHTQAPTGGRINLAGHPKQVRKLWKENLSEIFPLVGRLLDAECFGAVSDFGERFLTKYRDLMERRFEEGWIREVHGDLHCEHVCFAPEGIQIFDCIEFSQKLRCCDLASEIAFLLMDLEVRGAKSLGKEFLTRYLELMDDRDLPSLLPFYKCYRAMVRGKVEGLRPNGASAHAMRYFEYAGHVTWEGFKPFIIIVCGLTGSGKSTLARALSQRLGVPVINSDATRKALAGVSGRQNTDTYGEGIYTPAMTNKTYTKMAREAEKLIDQGEGAILDATFQRRAYRRAIFHMAARRGVPLYLIHCQSPEAVIRERLVQREKEARDLSDGRWEIYLQQKLAFEPITEVQPKLCLFLNTEASVSELCKTAERFLRAARKPDLASRQWVPF